MAQITIDTDKVKEKFANAAKKTAEVAKSAAGKVADAGEGAKKLADRNGDGKLDMDDVLLALNGCYDKSINGIPKVSKTVDEEVNEYITKYPDKRVAAEKLVKTAIAKCTTTGFLTGLGGLITLPVAIPADLATTWYVQLRMIASIARISGLEVRDEEVRTLIYACLAGVSVNKLAKQAGIKTGTKITQAAINKIPGKVMVAINKKVGFRFITKAGEKGIVNLTKLVPFVGGIISGGLDFAETRTIAKRAIKQFIDGDFEITQQELGDDLFIEVTPEEVADAPETV